MIFVDKEDDIRMCFFPAWGGLVCFKEHHLSVRNVS